MFKKKIILVILLIFSGSLYSQTMFKPLSKNFISNNKSKKVSLLVSLKAGYHSAYDEYSDRGFNLGMLFSGNVDVGLTDNIYSGVSYEFWDHYGEVSNIYNEKFERNSAGGNFSVNIIWKAKFNDAFFNIGFGLGSYTVNSEWEGNKSSRSYLNYKFIVGLDVKFSKVFLISSGLEYNYLSKFENPANIFSFKIGPAILLNSF